MGKRSFLVLFRQKHTFQDIHEHSPTLSSLLLLLIAPISPIRVAIVIGRVRRSPGGGLIVVRNQHLVVVVNSGSAAARAFGSGAPVRERVGGPAVPGKALIYIYYLYRTTFCTCVHSDLEELYFSIEV